MYRFVLLLCAAMLACSGCFMLDEGRGDPLAKFKGDDYKMMHAAKTIATAVNNYHSNTAEWPETLAETHGSLPPGEPWPVEPYNGKPVADTGSPNFNKDTSVGMVYYQPLYRNDMIVNYQLHVFGKRGKLYIIGNTAFGPKE